MMAALALACGDDDDDSPTGPSGGSAVLAIENFTATSTAGAGGTSNYRTSLRLRETGGAAATITGVTLTVVQSSGVTAARDVPPADAFATTMVAANGTLDSNMLSVSNVPIQASQLRVRIAYSSPNGTSSAVEASTAVTAG